MLEKKQRNAIAEEEARLSRKLEDLSKRQAMTFIDRRSGLIQRRTPDGKVSDLTKAATPFKAR